MEEEKARREAKEHLEPPEQEEAEGLLPWGCGGERGPATPSFRLRLPDGRRNRFMLLGATPFVAATGDKYAVSPTRRSETIKANNTREMSERWAEPWPPRPVPGAWTQ